MWQLRQSAAVGARLVMVVVRRVVVQGQMAVQADVVAGAALLQAVGVVAVRAGDARHVHLALRERRVLVDLFEDLAVRVVEARRRACAGR